MPRSLAERPAMIPMCPARITSVVASSLPTRSHTGSDCGRGDDVVVLGQEIEHRARLMFSRSMRVTSHVVFPRHEGVLPEVVANPLAECLCRYGNAVVHPSMHRLPVADGFLVAQTVPQVDIGPPVVRNGREQLRAGLDDLGREVPHSPSTNWSTSNHLADRATS